MSSGSYGPVRRAAGMLGLLALVPTGIGLLSGTLDPTDAAIRAVATMAGAVLVARVASWWLRGAVEAARPPATEPGDGPAVPAGAPRRRATDHQQEP